MDRAALSLANRTRSPRCETWREIHRMRPRSCARRLTRRPPRAATSVMSLKTSNRSSRCAPPPGARGTSIACGSWPTISAPHGGRRASRCVRRSGPRTTRCTCSAGNRPTIERGLVLATARRRRPGTARTVDRSGELPARDRRGCPPGSATLTAALQARAALLEGAMQHQHNGVRGGRPRTEAARWTPLHTDARTPSTPGGAQRASNARRLP